MGRDLPNRPPLCWGINDLRSLSSHHPEGDGKTKFKGFKFESYWLAMPGFWEVVSQTWENPLHATDPVRRLHIKLSRTTKALKKWEKSCIGNTKMQLAITKEVIWLLDQAQERRALTNEEEDFRTRLKEIYLRLVTVQKIKAH
jgi:hypothetical protein